MGGGGNITMNHKVVQWEFVEGISLVQVRDQWAAIVNTVMNF